MCSATLKCSWCKSRITSAAPRVNTFVFSSNESCPKFHPFGQNPVPRKIIVSQGMPMDLPKAATGEEVQNVFSVELTTDGKARVDSVAVDTDDAIAGLAKQAKAKNRDVRVVIRADKKVEHGRVIRVLDILKQAGLAKFAFGVAPAPRDDAQPAAAPR